ncbi:hypothetical protein PIB30_071531 [Stylosanthes scabra]|uniref:Uncharacterized protein n=1 Tax=Stylosanthes scabra TaxID=79078 RepID=A0ABU6SQA3_9FABA|nr:hypothetical protein [Stylosanthes scabra]
MGWSHLSHILAKLNRDRNVTRVSLAVWVTFGLGRKRGPNLMCGGLAKLPLPLWMSGLGHVSKRDLYLPWELDFSLEASRMKNGERKLEEQERRNLEHSARAPMPRHGDSCLGVQSSSPGLSHPRLGMDLGVPSPPQGQVIHA